jgi:hypothetical protein
MDEAQELVNLAVVERVILVLALLLPALGLALGVARGALRGRWLPDGVRGLIAGLVGPLIWGLWQVYNAIEDFYGLDSVKALLINLALFLIVGIAVGVGVRAFGGAGVPGRQPHEPEFPSPEPPTPEHLNT